MKILEKLIESFEKLPGIGPKTAERLAYSVLDLDDEYVKEFAQNLIDAKTKIKRCKICGMYCDGDICDVCKDKDRISDTLIVVSSTKDAIAIEKATKKYKYFVLNGNISLLKNITPDKLNIPLLLTRIETENIKEVILATSSTLDGETTARYLSNILENKVKVTRLAYGLPMGSELEYLDTLTLEKAISGRNKI